MTANKPVLMVIPTLGVSPFLAETLASVADWTDRVDVVVVGPQGARARVGEIAPEAEFVAEQGTGLYPAINQVARGSKSWSWLTYLNDDDVLLPGFDQTLQSLQGGNNDVVYGRVNYLTGDGSRMVRMPVESRPKRLRCLMAAGVVPLTQQGVLISRSCFEALDGFDERYRLAADFEFWVRAVLASMRFHFVRADVAAFRIQPNQLSSAQSIVQEEMAAIAAENFAGMWAGSAAVLRFRLANLWLIAKRRWVFGGWISSQLYREDHT